MKIWKESNHWFTRYWADKKLSCQRQRDLHHKQYVPLIPYHKLYIPLPISVCVWWGRGGGGGGEEEDGGGGEGGWVRHNCLETLLFNTKQLEQFSPL